MDKQHPPAQAHQEDPEAERSLLAELLESSRLYHTGEDYLELLDFTSRLRNFAPFNAMLLHLLKAAGQVETALGIAAHTLFEPKADRSHG